MSSPISISSPVQQQEVTVTQGPGGTSTTTITGAKVKIPDAVFPGALVVKATESVELGNIQAQSINVEVIDPSVTPEQLALIRRLLGRRDR